MLHLVKISRSYGPETIAAMTAAYDRVCQSLSTRINGNEDAMQSLALIILRHVDQGESDPARQTATVRQRDDCPLGQVSPRLGTLAAVSACVHVRARSSKLCLSSPALAEGNVVGDTD
jgi:hypothetical protein